MTGCSCMSGGKRRRTRRTRRRRSRRSKRKTNKHHRRRSSRHRRSRRSKRTRRRRGGLRSEAAYMGVGTGSPSHLQTGGNSLATNDYKVSGGYKKRREEARVQKQVLPIQVVFIKRPTIYIKISSNNHYIMGHGCPFKKSTAKMRWKWKKKRTRRLQRKRRKMRARAK